MSLGQFDDLVAGLDDAPCPRDDFFACGGQRHALGRTLDELHAEVVLEFPELRRQRRLAHEAAFRGPAEMARVRQCDEVMQVLELEVGHRCSLSSLSNQSIGRNGGSPGECAPT
jgi:hypothetical protein